MTGTVTSKGQVTIPVEARRRLGIVPGTALEFVVTDAGTLVVIPRSRSVRDLKGMLPRPKRALSVAEMERAIHKGALA
jgi:AbrB family looped-hinge helix DNA binding protein